MRVADVLDVEAALERFGQDVSLFHEAGELFRLEVPRLLRDSEAAAHAGDVPVVKRLAHTVRGYVGAFGGQRAPDAAFLLEQAASDGRVSEIRRHWEALNEECGRLFELIQVVRAGETPEEMKALAQRWADSQAERAAVAAPPDRPEAVFDEAEALAEAGGERDLLKLLVDQFIEDEPGFLPRIGHCIASKDGKGLAGVAQELAGRVGAFSGPGMKAARRLEALGDRGDFDEAGQALAALRGVLDSLRPALTAWSRASSGGAGGGADS